MTGPQIRSITLGVVCSTALLFLAVRNLDFSALVATFAKAQLVYIPLIAVGMLLGIWIRAERWRLLLPGQNLPRGPLFRLVTIGLAVNNVLPLRLGEIARALLAAKELKVPLLTVLASVFIERLFDALTILTLFMVSAYLEQGSPWVDKMLPLLIPLYAVLLIGFAGCFLLEWFLEKSRILASALVRRPRLHRFVDQLVLGFKPLRSPAVLLPVLLWGLVLWLVDAGNYFWSGKAVLLGIALGYPYAVIVLGTAGMSTVLPTAPGYIGAFEYAVSESLKPLGVLQEDAFGYALFLHMIIYILTTALGIYFLYREGNTLRGIWEQARGGHGDKEGAG